MKKKASICGGTKNKKSKCKWRDQKLKTSKIN